MHAPHHEAPNCSTTALPCACAADADARSSLTPSICTGELLEVAGVAAGVLLAAVLALAVAVAVAVAVADADADAACCFFFSLSWQASAGQLLIAASAFTEEVSIFTAYRN